MNTNIKKFEEEFKKYVKSKDCVAVNSGTAALNLALSLSNSMAINEYNINDIKLKITNGYKKYFFIR